MYKAKGKSDVAAFTNTFALLIGDKIRMTLFSRRHTVVKLTNDKEEYPTSQGRHFNLQAPCVLYIGHAFRYSPENAFYTGCNRRNGPDFGRVFLMLNYTEKPQNTYIQSSMVTEI